MAKSVSNQYVPDTVTPPGYSLEETLAERGLTQVDFAQRIGMSRKHLKQILEGEAPITSETALKLERALGIPARFWNNREQHYRDFLARQDEARELAKRLEWLKSFRHIKRMAEFGWLPLLDDKVEQFRAVLDFFGVASPDTFDAHWGKVAVKYRKSARYEPDTYALAAWLRQGELDAQEIDCEPYDEEKFQKTLRKIRRTTADPPEEFQPRLIELCAACGVAVVFVPELPKTASGATRWLGPHKALIQLSLKYKTDDHLWFTFFHEAGHILLHGKTNIYIETPNSESAEEEEANRFAARTLINPKRFRAFIDSHKQYTKENIRAFAAKEKIAPGIVVGQLQHRVLLPRNYCNDLKRRFEWAKSEDE